MPVSAEHGEGMANLFEALSSAVDANDAGAPDAIDANEGAPLQLAIVGRPNVGKSTLVNQLIGEDRLLTGPEAGITRDAIAIEWAYEGRPLRLVDTAGLRRRARVDHKLEKLSAGPVVRLCGIKMEAKPPC